MPAIAELRTSDVKLDGEIVPFVKLMDFSPMLEPEKQKKIGFKQGYRETSTRYSMVT